MSATRAMVGSGPGRVERAREAIQATFTAILIAAHTRTRTSIAHLREHAYTLLGFGCISAASFWHSVFAGLLVTGILLLVFEWKVSD